MTQPTIERNKDIVRRLFDAMRSGNVDAFDDLIAENYVQHNPMAENGLAAVKAFFAQIGPVDVQVYRMIAEGDLFAAHSHYRSINAAVVDIWRISEEGKLIEHWDVVQQVPEKTASGNDMFSQLT